MKLFVSLLGATLLLGGTALANDHVYKPAKGVNVGGGNNRGAAAPRGIHPECAAKTTRADMKDCIKEKAQERGKARIVKGRK